MLKKLADHVMSKKHVAVGGHGAKKGESVTVKAANVLDVILGILYPVVDPLTALIKPGPDDGKA